FIYLQSADCIRERNVTGFQTCALPISRLHIGTLSYLRNGKPCGHRECRSWPLFSRPVHLATLDSCLSLGEVGVPNRAGFVRENLWQVFLQNCVNLLCYSANTCVSGFVVTLRDEL